MSTNANPQPAPTSPAPNTVPAGAAIIDGGSAAGTQATIIPLTQLRPDITYQPRMAGVDPAHIALLVASDAAQWPPLLVTPADDGRYDISDGFHRHEAAQRLGLSALPCLVREDAGYPEAIAANLRHGLPLSLGDRQEYVAWLHEREPHLSQRAIALRTGLSQSTVSRLLADASQRDSAESPADGTAIYPTPAKQRSAVEQIIKLFAKATRNNEGIGLHGWGRDQRAKLVRQYLVEQPEEEQPELAKMLHGWANIFTEETAIYLQPRR